MKNVQKQALLNSWSLDKLKDKLPHSVPKGPKLGKLKTRKGRASLKTREGLVQGKTKPKIKKVKRRIYVVFRS
jgi:hypothetical protein